MVKREMSRVNIQDIMYDARRKLALTHISMGIASDVASETYRENSAQWDRFVYVLSGERIFDFGEQTVFLHTGDMLLIPVGLPYRSRSAGRETCRMGVINVQLRDEESGEVVRFCDAPTLLFHDEHGVYSGLMEEIERKQNAVAVAREANGHAGRNERAEGDRKSVGRDRVF